MDFTANSLLDSNGHVDFVVQEEQVMKGINLIYSDKLNEAEEYFDAMKPGSLRYSLHHAEVASYIALMSCEELDIQHATTLLNETEALAAQLAQKYRTHSNMKRMNEAVSTLKNWALGRISKKNLQGPSTVTDNETEQQKVAVSNEQTLRNHRQRRARLWALQIQAECYLMSSLLQIVGAGESWTAIVKMGYGLRRTWVLYKHCLNKLRQITREWIAMGGSFEHASTLSAIEGSQSSSSDSDAEDPADSMKADPDLHQRNTSRSASLDFSNVLCGNSTTSREEKGEVSSVRTRLGSDNQSKVDEIESDEQNCSMISELLLLDSKNNVKEDSELASLRVALQFGEGALNVIVSLIPTSYQKALEVIGLPVHREKGLRLLRIVSSAYHPRAPLASVMLLYYYTVILGLLSPSLQQLQAAREVLNAIPATWRSCSFFRMLHSRLERCEHHLIEATALLYPVLDEPVGRGNIQILKNLMLDELGWCLLLQGEFAKAAQCFNKRMEETICFKPFYACLQYACLWESVDTHRGDAEVLLRDMPVLLGSKKQQQFTPVEQYALRLSTTFITNNQAPLFPALELAAVYNGFQFMDRATLEKHKRRVEEVLQGRSQAHKKPESIQEFKVENDQAADGKARLSDGEAVTVPSVEASRLRLHYEHKWSKSSKMMCRFLVGLCEKHLGEKERADDNFRYVISNSNVYCGNIVPYGCYELASMMLSEDDTRAASSTEALQLLRQCVDYPPHEFQGRLKFTAGEESKHYQESQLMSFTSSETTLASRGSGGGSFRRVSENIMKGVGRRQSNKY